MSRATARAPSKTGARSLKSTRIRKRDRRRSRTWNSSSTRKPTEPAHSCRKPYAPDRQLEVQVRVMTGRRQTSDAVLQKAAHDGPGLDAGIPVARDRMIIPRYMAQIINA